MDKFLGLQPPPSKKLKDTKASNKKYDLEERDHFKLVGALNLIGFSTIVLKKNVLQTLSFCLWPTCFKK